MEVTVAQSMLADAVRLAINTLESEESDGHEDVTVVLGRSA